VNTVLDPYTIAMEAFNPQSAEKVGMGVLVDERFLAKVAPLFNTKNLSDVIAYEAHIRDLTIHTSSGVKQELAGTYLGVENKISYFKKLGITHLQLLPIYNHYRVNENSREFQGGDVLKL
jgi:pullulanase/glycogen debranching enzyme